jgi:hypothetical protein
LEEKLVKKYPKKKGKNFFLPPTWSLLLPSCFLPNSKLAMSKVESLTHCKKRNLGGGSETNLGKGAMK